MSGVVQGFRSSDRRSRLDRRRVPELDVRYRCIDALAGSALAGIYTSEVEDEVADEDRDDAG